MKNKDSKAAKFSTVWDNAKKPVLDKKKAADKKIDKKAEVQEVKTNG